MSGRYLARNPRSCFSAAAPVARSASGSRGRDRSRATRATGDRRLGPGRARAGTEVALLDDAHVVITVPGNDERERSNTERAAIGIAAPGPGPILQAAEQRERASTHRVELLDQLGEALVVESRMGDVVVLVEARERGLIRAREAQRAVGEDSLRVGDMAEHLLDAPLLRRITQRALRFVQASEKAPHHLALALQRRHRLVLRDERDVLPVVGGMLLGGGANGGDETHGCSW